MAAAQSSLFETAPETPEPERSLRAAREQVLDALPNGGIQCPCCDQFARVYVRKLAATAVVVLLRLRGVRAQQPTHMPTFLRDEGFSASYYPDVIRTKWWGLIEEVGGAGKHDGAAKPGVYRLTQLGVDFLAGHVTVPARVATYNDELYGPQPGEQTDVRKALGRRFSYDELMAARPPAAAVDNTTGA